MEGVTEKTAVKRVLAALLARAIAGNMQVLSERVRGAPAAAGHPHAVYPTSYSELVACTNAIPMIVGKE